MQNNSDQLAYISENVVLVVLAKNEGNRIDRLLNSVALQGVEKVCGSAGDDVWIPEAAETSLGFGVARERSLDAARLRYPGAEWALLLDADMQLMGSLAELCPLLVGSDFVASKMGGHERYDNIHLIQKDGTYEYDNVRLVRLRPARRCFGRTHELWESLGSSVTDHEKRCWIQDHCDGANRGDKYARDEALLRMDLADNPNSERTVYYLAQTLDGAGKLEEAIELYTKRVTMGGFEQEAWIARVRAGECYLKAAGHTKGIGILLDAWARKPWRAEPLYLIAQTMCKTDQHEAALGISDMMANCEIKQGDLFSEPGAYVRGGADIQATSAYAVGDRELGMSACEELLKHPETHLGRALERQSWYLGELGGGSPKQINVLPMFLEGDRWAPTNPCITEYGTNVRLVNYHQDNGRNYVSRDDDGKIRTRNIWITGDDPSLQEEWFYTLEGAETDHEIRGLEDVRFNRELVDERAVFTATCCECPGEEGNPQVVIGSLDLETMQARVVPIKYAGKQKYEKNWVILEAVDTFPNKVKVLYSLNPTVVLTVMVATGEVVETSIKPGPLPSGSGLWRNSTPPVPMYGRYVMLAHDVGRREDQNIYMHRWVWLNSDWSIYDETEPFTIKHTGVEYACGLIRIGTTQRLRISFGVNDREAWTIDVSP